MEVLKTVKQVERQWKKEGRDALTLRGWLAAARPVDVYGFVEGKKCITFLNGREGFAIFPVAAVIDKSVLTEIDQWLRKSNKTRGYTSRFVSKLFLKEAETMEKNVLWMQRQFPTHESRMEGMHEEFIFRPGDFHWKKMLQHMQVLSEKTLHKELLKVESKMIEQQDEIMEHVLPIIGSLRNEAGLLSRGLIRNKDRRRVIANKARSIRNTNLNFAKTMAPRIKAQEVRLVQREMPPIEFRDKRNPTQEQQRKADGY